MIKNDIIDYDESIKREYESNCFNDKFFEIFPTKYEKMLRKYEVIILRMKLEFHFLIWIFLMILFGMKNVILLIE